MTHRAKKAKKATWRTIKGVGRRCVKVLANGKWVFVKNSACAR